MKIRLIIGAILAALLLLMQYRLWIAEDSLPDAWRLEQQIETRRAEIKQLELRNHNLAADVKDLKTGHAAIEARARRELGMVKEGETFYRIIRPRPAPEQRPLTDNDKRTGDKAVND